LEGVVTEIYVDGDACPVREEVYRVGLGEYASRSTLTEWCAYDINDVRGTT